MCKREHRVHQHFSVRSDLLSMALCLAAIDLAFLQSSLSPALPRIAAQSAESVQAIPKPAYRVRRSFYNLIQKRSNPAGLTQAKLPCQCKCELSACRGCRIRSIKRLHSTCSSKYHTTMAFCVIIWGQEATSIHRKASWVHKNAPWFPSLASSPGGAKPLS